MHRRVVPMHAARVRMEVQKGGGERHGSALTRSRPRDAQCRNLEDMTLVPCWSTINVGEVVLCAVFSVAAYYTS